MPGLLKRFLLNGIISKLLLILSVIIFLQKTPPTSSVFLVSMEEREHWNTFCLVPMLTWRMELTLVSRMVEY